MIGAFISRQTSRRAEVFRKIKTTLLWVLITIPFILIINALPGCGGSARLILTDEDLVGSWKVEMVSTYNDRKGFYSALDGGAELFIQYGLSSLIIHKLKDSRGHEINIEIFKMKKGANLNPLFDRYKSLASLPYGDKASASPGNLVFYKDNYFIKMYVNRLYDEADDDLRSIALIVDEKLSAIQ